MSERQQPWSDEPAEHGRILVLSDNPISQAIAAIAAAVGREVLVEAADDGGPGLDPRAGDAVVLCDHDAPDAPAVLRAALASEASYVAMMASRRRAAALLDELVEEGVDVAHAARARGAQPRRQGTRRDRPVGGGRDRGRGLRPPRRPDARARRAHVAASRARSISSSAWRA